MKRVYSILLVLACTMVSEAATLALWDFNDPSLGATNRAALPDSDAYTVWREAAADKSGNGNALTTWDYPGAGFYWSSISPEGDFSIKAAGSYPAAYTWSTLSSPSGTDLETVMLSQFTIEGVFTVAGSGSRTLVGRDGQNLSASSPDNAALYFQIDGGNHPAFEFTDVNSNRVRLVASTTVVSDDATWYHMAGVSDGSTVSLYLNHQLIASTNVAMGAIAAGTTSGSDWHAGGWSVARGLYAGNHTDRWFGNIDSIAISDTALDTNSFVLPVPNYTTPVPSLADVTNNTVYLFCYHEGYYPGGGGSGVFLSWSTDGYDFYPLNHGHPVFVPPEFPGDDAQTTSPNLTRDPSMIYRDGKFRVVFTSAISSRSFGYAESTDLVHWSNVKLVQIWKNNPNTVDHTWAPEWFYNADNGKYMIIFSTGLGGANLALWYTETTDFNTFSDPVELFNNGGSIVIDGCVAKVSNGHYMLAYKNDPVNTEIWIADSVSPYGPWTNERQATAGGDEAPLLTRIGNKWHLYWDNFGYSDNVFGLATSTDTTNWVDVSGTSRLPAKVDVPDYGYDGGPPHHGTVFAVPRSALGAFMVPLQDNVTNLSSLVYRWSFNEPAGSVASGTTITDSVSGAVAVVNGNRASFTGTGLQLPGDTTGTGDAAYVDLPNGIISSLTNLTVEIWATPETSKNWQRLFSFGRTVETGAGGGEWTGPASGGTSAQKAMYWTINVGTDINKQNCAMVDVTDTNVDAVSGTGMDTTPSTQYHYVFTFEAGVGFFGATGGRMTFYRNGIEIGWRDVPFLLKDIPDVNNWLGRSQWSGDSNSNVAYDEVRIYSTALSAYDIYGDYLAGPNVVVNENPRLKLELAGNNTKLSWPGNAVGFSLKKADALNATTMWSTVTNAVQNSTNGLYVTLPLPADQAFYRLGQ